MRGDALDDAKRALIAGIRQLRPSDHFDIIDFDDNLDEFRPNLVPAIPDNKMLAIDYASAIEVRRLTNILKPLQVRWCGCRVLLCCKFKHALLSPLACLPAVSKPHNDSLPAHLTHALWRAPPPTLAPLRACVGNMCVPWQQATRILRGGHSTTKRAGDMPGVTPVNYVFLLTDGAVQEEKQICSFVAEQMKDIRLMTFGIGQ